MDKPDTQKFNNPPSETSQSPAKSGLPQKSESVPQPPRPVESADKPAHKSDNSDKSKSKVKKGKLRTVGKLLADVGHFLFDKKADPSDITKDLEIIEKHRARETEAEKMKRLEREAEAKMKEVEKLVEAEAKTAEERRRQAKAEAKDAEKAAQAKQQTKQKGADRLASERAKLAQQQQAAWHLKSTDHKKHKVKKQSWWSRLFGSKKSKGEVIKLPLDKPVPPDAALSRPNFMHPKAKPAKQSWWSRLFGSKKKTKSGPTFKEIKLKQPQDKAHPLRQAKPHQPLPAPPQPRQSWPQSSAKPSIKSSVDKAKPAASPVSGGSVSMASPQPPKFDKAKAKTAGKDLSNKEKAAKHFHSELQRHLKVTAKLDIENRDWQSFNMVRTNLVKDHSTMFFNWQGRILALVLFMAIAGLVNLLIYGGLLVWEKDRFEKHKDIFDNLDSINAQLNAESKLVTEVSNFNNRLIYVDYILDNHIYWTNFFELLEEYTIAASDERVCNDATCTSPSYPYRDLGIYYESFSGDIAGKYDIPTVGKNYRSVFYQLKVLKSSPFVREADTPEAETLVADSVAVQELAEEAPATDNPPGESEGAEESQVKEPNPENDKVKFVLNLLMHRTVFLK